MERSDAVAALERLGLTAYEAKVFIALQELDSGTAREVHQVADVPRSQVYGAAETLADYGLLDVERANPIRYRPVSIEEARATLRARFEAEQDRAFDYVERVRRQRADKPEETEEAVWTIRGTEGVTDRTVSLIDDARNRVTFGTRLPTLVTEEIADALRERAAAGVAVTVVSIDESVRDQFAADDGIETGEPPAHYADDDLSGRFLYADGDTLLLSVVGTEREETAIWSAKTNFATVLTRLVEASVGRNGAHSSR